MSGVYPWRRIVTGIGADGRSCVAIDGPVNFQSGSPVGIAWRTDGVPADNAGTADIDGRPYGFDMMHAGGTIFTVLEHPPGMGAEGPYWHATDTIDYLVVLRGEVTLVLESGEVRAGPGDFIVDRGVVHAWRNDGEETAAMAAIIIPAKPLGAGRTV
jgi:mannose-6-phosphate isomerase-like protein (cupin superfamily)